MELKVIQNYYERHGNFDKINNSYTGAIRDNYFKDTEDLYELLGYKCAGRLKPKQVHDLRIAYLADDMKTAYKISGYKTQEEITTFLKQYGMLPEALRTKDLIVSAPLRPYVDALAEYYRNCNSYISVNSSFITLKDALAFIKHNPKKIRGFVKEIITNNPNVLVKTGMCDIDKDVEIYGRTMYVARGFSPKQMNIIQHKAMLKAAMGDAVLPTECANDPLKLFTLGLTDTEKYLQLLETAELEGCTLAQYLAKLNIHLPNCENMYKNIGMLIAKCMGRSVVIARSENGETFAQVMKESEADQLCMLARRG